MAKVLCTIENASELISDVRFVKHKDGMISEEISDEQSAFFLSVTGFHPVEKDGAPKKRGRPPKIAEQADEPPGDGGHIDGDGSTASSDDTYGDQDPLY